MQFVSFLLICLYWRKLCCSMCVYVYKPAHRTDCIPAMLAAVCRAYLSLNVCALVSKCLKITVLRSPLIASDLARLDFSYQFCTASLTTSQRPACLQAENRTNSSVYTTAPEGNLYLPGCRSQSLDSVTSVMHAPIDKLLTRRLNSRVT